MLRNYFTLSFRSLTKDKTSTIINLLGLVVGITCFIALALFVIDELGYDTFHKNSDRIYRTYVHSVINGEESVNSKTPAPLGETLKEHFPEVEKFTRVGYTGIHQLKYGDNIYREGAVYTADSTYFEIFDFSLIAGNPHTVLDKPNSIVISEKAAQKYFGNENPMGKTITVDNRRAFIVTGLMKNFPEKSHFRCNYLMSMSSYQVSESQYWLDLWYITYIVLKEHVDPDKFEKRLPSVVSNFLGPQAERVLGFPMKDFFANGNQYEYLLQPLTSIYLYSQRDCNIDLNSEWSDVKSSDITYVYIVSIVAVFILLLAVINFVNLTTAKSEKRAKEVGIRKTLGSERSKLIWQFITESIIMVFLAVILSTGLLELVLPVFSNFLHRDLNLGFFTNPLTIPLLISFILFVGILAGSYPAFYLSSFQPVQVIKPGYSKHSRKQTLRSVMVISQFTVSITLIVGTIIINNQLKFIQNKNLGFNKDFLVSIDGIDAVTNRLESFKNELRKNRNIISLTNSSRMFQAGVPGTGYLFDQTTGMNIVSANYLDVDYDFLNTFKIDIKEGRFFSKDFSTDSTAVVINEAAAREFSKDDPIGRIVTRIENKKEYDVYKIIGIVKDFNYQSLRESVHPLFLHLSEVRQPANILTLRISSSDITGTIDYIKETWRNFAGDEYLNFGFVNEKLERLYENEKRMGTITTVFSILAIFIACLGLFGLVAFVAEQKTREIGIRKVMGATVFEIITLLSKQFTRWIIVSSMVAWPVAYYFMQIWLQDFAYRVTIEWWVFVTAGAIALLIALATISYQAVKAALANPVESLKCE